MKKTVFLSFSIEDSNLYLITLLLEHLQKNNYSVSVSAHWEGSDIKIATSDIYIGIITNNSNSVNYVVKEWKIAKQNNIPYVLIVENGVKITNPQSISVIKFDRSSPEKAIIQLFQIKNSNHPISKKEKNNDDLVSDILKGTILIAGLAALISLLGKKK